jgi:hypothetical protein
MEPDYYVVTFAIGDRLSPWCWAIERRGRPMGIKLGAGGYPTQIAVTPKGPPVPKVGGLSFGERLPRGIDSGGRQ